ncbi:hypothetical protein BV898_14231 [Hypsibius exemplaris]|uniref:SH3 domain-containing protein n=1 Tax=Hypsibius exemplaris TaxID=2072580 RepID=A0A1W0W8A1_HYPEX|nr:hypothetical protein BV898_14231 [Hypsibius exemplaris]
MDKYATTDGAAPSYSNEYTQVLFPNGSSEYGATDEFGYCRALFDYSADDPEDLSVQEGDLIRVLSRTGSNGVDDGWWKGELNGKIGMFMVAITEELVDSDRASDLGASISSNSSPLPAQIAKRYLTAPYNYPQLSKVIKTSVNLLMPQSCASTTTIATN